MTKHNPQPPKKPEVATPSGQHRPPVITKGFGPEYTAYPGFIAEPGAGPFPHRFGGNSWQVIDEKEVCGGPSLLMTLSLADSRLETLKSASLEELPLCSYVNTDIVSGNQIFEIQPASRRVMMLQHRQLADYQTRPEFLLPTRITEVPLSLRPMRDDEYPTTLENLYRAQGNLHGGPAFIRILGAPVFGDGQTVFPCACGRTMTFVATIGWESAPTGRMLNGKEFFIGEGTLNFYFCPHCLFLLVHGDGTE
jgi:hypothetical protein